MGATGQRLRAPAPGAAPELALLGGFRLTTREAGLVTVSRPAQQLLAYLAVHRERPVRRTALWGHLWTESDAQHASSSLRSTLWRLPRIRGRPLVVSSPHHLALAPSLVVDLWDSQERARALVHGDPDRWPGDHHRLCRLFSHDLLPDWQDDWLLVEQEAHRQLRLHALERLSGALRRAGDHPAAILTGSPRSPASRCARAPTER